MVEVMKGYHILIRNTLAQHEANAVFSYFGINQYIGAK